MLLEERIPFKHNMLAMCSSPKPLRTFSPAVSEISVGSPSPPMPTANIRVMPLNKLRHPPGAFQPPLQMKRQRLSQNSPPIQNERRARSAERIKSFSIADILGKKDDQTSNENKSSSPMNSPKLPFSNEVPPVADSMLAERLQSVQHMPVTLPVPVTVSVPVSIPLPPGIQPMLLEIPDAAATKPTLTQWDPAAFGSALPVRPFFSPAHLLHYEQRLAWDYQRQLQEHFQLQAQMLRQMSMDPNVIQSEDGSERDSRSRNSTGSACCSPEVNVNSNDSVSENAEKSTKDASSTKNSNDIDERRETSGENSSDNKNKKCAPGDTPLDALFQLSTKNFDEEQDPTALSIFAARPNPKKKRKSRTAFTNHQIFELEKRFLYQKYLSPADRDEIAAGLGLSNAQVITWFQNRRAKLKRDMEELKKDVESVKQLSAHKSFLENVNDLSILKTRPVSRHQTPITTAASAAPPSGQAVFHRPSPQPTCTAVMATPATSTPYAAASIAIDDDINLREISNQQPRTQQHNNRG